MKIATILSAHENSEVYRDTLDSVYKNIGEDVVVLVDGFGWNQFEGERVDKIEGFRHGKPNAPYRNMALGLMEAWDRWKSDAEWYCYMEYDCLVGSSEVKEHLKMADDRGFWMLGNDLRRIACTMPFLDRLEEGISGLHYFLGCCQFFSQRFMEKLAERRLFQRLLETTNFFTSDPVMFDSFGKLQPVYDPSEFIYPTLAVHYGGSVEQLACWDGSSWTGNFHHYPMRFKPDLSGDDPVHNACVMHPIKEMGPIRQHYRKRRDDASTLRHPS